MDLIVEKVKVVELTLEDGSKMLCRGGEEAVFRTWERYPVVSPESKPPVARLMDYGKYKYELSQKAKSSRKNQVKINVKEMQLKPKIDTHDFQNKLNQSKKFLSEGDKVKFTMRFRGREAEHPEFGQRVLDRLKEELSEISEIESTSKPDGRSLTMVLAPNGVKK